MKHTLKCASILALLFCLSGTSGTQPASAPRESVVSNPGEVRLRKLHLVRPDLIRYPLMLEVCC